MWKYIVLWTIVSITPGECPQKDPKQFGVSLQQTECNARHLSYHYDKRKIDSLTRKEAFKTYRDLQRLEIKTAGSTERVTKVKIDSVYIDLKK